MTRTRRSIGIRGKVFAAIAVIAGFTVLATVVATISFIEISGLFNGVAKRSLPNVMATFELAGESQELSAALSPLFSARVKSMRWVRDAVATGSPIPASAERASVVVGASNG